MSAPDTPRQDAQVRAALDLRVGNYERVFALRFDSYRDVVGGAAECLGYVRDAISEVLDDPVRLETFVTSFGLWPGDMQVT